MDRERAFKKLILLEYTDHLDDNDRFDCLEWYYKKELKIDKIDFSDRVYLSNVLDDYKGRKKRNQAIYFAKFREDNF